MAAQQEWRKAFALRYGVTPPADAREQFLRNLRFASNRFWWVGGDEGFEIAGRLYDPEDVGAVMLSGLVSRETARGTGSHG